MAKQDAVFLIDPESIAGDNVQNAHVFDGSYDTTTQKWTCRSPSRCGNLRLGDSIKSLVRKTDEREFCHAVVDGQDISFNACGMCMASFFADGE